ncbi:hypothetical protein [Catenuloplanes atrovinosus]|uniref:Uncharacterized protein n=1 Tax=Catenuloplanes atrovinosus TaxID=137266 RepID=A0AAE4CBK6_9ACTN|nr:hypothetical protein [Catenuloplanes atrovinosus]MDR7278756.1 hypothetical protein [Catenuloplanes atrovinosus]
MSGVVASHGVTGAQDAGAFLVRLTRLDPGAVVRLRSYRGRTDLWAMLPWNVLVSRSVDGEGPGDATVVAADLLSQLARGGRSLPARRDADWRWGLPPEGARSVERLPAAEVRRIAAAAAGTLRDASEHGVGGQPVGARALRDALLDHVAIVVTTDSTERIEISQRLVQGVTRMGFLGGRPSSEESDLSDVHVRVAGRWVGLAAPYGVAWLPAVNQLGLRPATPHTFG